MKVVKRVPVLAGVCASDPFRRMDRFLLELERLGFDGIQNFPTVGLIDGNFRQNLEETGMGYGYVSWSEDLLFQWFQLHFVGCEL